MFCCWCLLCLDIMHHFIVHCSWRVTLQFLFNVLMERCSRTLSKHGCCELVLFPKKSHTVSFLRVYKLKSLYLKSIFSISLIEFSSVQFISTQSVEYWGDCGLTQPCCWWDALTHSWVMTPIHCQLRTRQMFHTIVQVIQFPL